VLDLYAGVTHLGQALDYHLERHNVLASNVAHVDTPGYHPRDLARVEQSSAFGEALGVALARTDASHLGAAGGGAEVTGRIFTDDSGGGGADGNHVTLEREAGKLAANQLRYDVVSALVSSELRGLLFAATDGKGG